MNLCSGRISECVLSSFWIHRLTVDFNFLLLRKEKQSIHQTEQLKGRSNSVLPADQKKNNPHTESRSHSENKVHLTLVSGTMD